MKTEELLDLIDEAYHNAAPVAFADRDTALKVVGAGLKFLTDLLGDENEDGSETEDTDSGGT